MTLSRLSPASCVCAQVWHSLSVMHSLVTLALKSAVLQCPSLFTYIFCQTPQFPFKIKLNIQNNCVSPQNGSLFSNDTLKIFIRTISMLVCFM